MSGGGHTDLAALADMMFRAEQSKLKGLIKHESAVRRDIAHLDATHKAGLSLPNTVSMAARSIGADVQWQSWLGESRARLNRQLALILARKERMIVALRHAHGRKLASDELLAQDLRTHKKLALKKEIEAADGLSLMLAKRRADNQSK